MSDDELLARDIAVRIAREEYEMWGDQGHLANSIQAAIIALIERHRAEVERLTRERDGLDGATTLMADTNVKLGGTLMEAVRRAEAAESALAAAQKRVGELETRVNNVIREYEAARVTDNELATKLVRLAHGTERAALAGPKESNKEKDPPPG